MSLTVWWRATTPAKATLKAHNRGCHVDAGRSHETPGSGMKDCVLHSSSGKSIKVVLLGLHTWSLKATPRKPGGATCAAGCATGGVRASATLILSSGHTYYSSGKKLGVSQDYVMHSYKDFLHFSRLPAAETVKEQSKSLTFVHSRYIRTEKGPSKLCPTGGLLTDVVRVFLSYMYMYICTCIYMYTCICTHICIYIHTYIKSCYIP